MTLESRLLFNVEEGSKMQLAIAKLIKLNGSEGYAVSQNPVASIYIKEYHESLRAFWKGGRLANAL